MAHTPIQFVIHLNLASTCDEIEGKGASVHRLKHCHFNQVMKTLKSCNDKETCQKVCSPAGLPRKKILDMHRFSRKTNDLVKNGRPKSTSTSTHTEAQIYFPASLKKKTIFNGNYIITHIRRLSAVNSQFVWFICMISRSITSILTTIKQLIKAVV